MVVNVTESILFLNPLNQHSEEDPTLTTKIGNIKTLIGNKTCAYQLSQTAIFRNSTIAKVPQLNNSHQVWYIWRGSFIYKGQNKQNKEEWINLVQREAWRNLEISFKTMVNFRTIMVEISILDLSRRVIAP